jgi:cell division protein FtsZ
MPIDRIATRFKYDEMSHDNARIKVLGVGGGGGNAVANMIKKGLNNVEYIVINTDAQALKNNPSEHAIQVGMSLTSGLGAGARPEIGREAVEENRHEIEEAIEGADMIFVTAGMGGGTGTGGAPVVAGIAKRKGILTVGIVTTPFLCEGRVRQRFAHDGISELKKSCDTVIVIPNEKLLEVCSENASLMEAFDVANEVLYNATKGISDLILLPGLINLDFADVRTTMQDGGAAIMGSASASGTDRAEIAARAAINSPLLDGVSIRGARNVLVNISADMSLGMREVTMATSIIQSEAGEDAEIIMGTVTDPSMGDELRMTVIATGFEIADERRAGSTINIKVGNDPKPRVLAAETTERVERASTDHMTGKATLPRSQDIHRIFTGTANTTEGKEPYKGESNLKGLDTPALHRRGITMHTLTKRDGSSAESDSVRDSMQVEKPRQYGTGNTLLNDREERINKTDSEQPAFLRRAMD